MVEDFEKGKKGFQSDKGRAEVQKGIGNSDDLPPEKAEELRRLLEGAKATGPQSGADDFKKGKRDLQVGKGQDEVRKDIGNVENLSPEQEAEFRRVLAGAKATEPKGGANTTGHGLNQLGVDAKAARVLGK